MLLHHQLLVAAPDFFGALHNDPVLGTAMAEPRRELVAGVDDEVFDVNAVAVTPSGSFRRAHPTSRCRFSRLQPVRRPCRQAAIISGAKSSAKSSISPKRLLSSTSIPSLAAAPVGLRAKASISQLAELARDPGKAEPVGNDNRRHPPAFVVNLRHGTIAEVPVLALCFVETEPALRFSDRRIGAAV
jgi:hypothetical protein